MPDKATTVPDMDQSSGDDSHEINLADIISNSPIMAMASDEDKSQSDDLNEETDDSDEDDLDNSDEDANDEDDNEGELGDTGDDEDDEDEDDSTQNSDDSDTEIDWKFELPINIDGEESNVTLEELRKGYQTSKHLSNQGRELGDQRKAFDKEQKDKLAEITVMADVMAETLMADENKYALEYNSIKDEITELRKDGDKFAVADKKDELEVAQENYWKANKLRVKSQEDIKVKQAEVKKVEWDAKVKDFSERIDDFVPNFDEKTATSVRSFAIEQGIPEAIIDQVTSPEMVKFVNDYRLQMEKLNKGTVKRKKTVKRKVSPTKKNLTSKQKATNRSKDTSARLASGKLTESEGDNFLLGIASKHFK